MKRTKPIDSLVEELIQAKVQQKIAKIVQREKSRANREMIKVREILALPEPKEEVIEAETVEEEDTGLSKPLSFRKRG